MQGLQWTEGERVSVTYEQEETRVMSELASFWPNGSMKPQRLKKGYITQIKQDSKQQAEAGAAGAGEDEAASVRFQGWGLRGQRGSSVTFPVGA